MMPIYLTPDVWCSVAYDAVQGNPQVIPIYEKQNQLFYNLFAKMSACTDKTQLFTKYLLNNYKNYKEQ